MTWDNLSTFLGAAMAATLAKIFDLLDQPRKSLVFSGLFAILSII